MSSLVEDDLTRAASFFSLTLSVAIVLGLLLGDLRLGVRWGLGLGAAFGVFAYFFLAPTSQDGPAGDGGGEDPDVPDDLGDPGDERDGGL